MLNIFLPAPKPGTKPSAPVRALKRLGTSWRASPFTRLIQAAAFACFLILFLWSSWPFSGDTPITPDLIPSKEFLPTQSFLAIDPIVSLSAAIAARTIVWSLWCALGVFLVNLLVPGGFCAYLCPLGATIDLFDGLIGRRIPFLRLAKREHRSWWVGLRYYLLLAVLLSAAAGVMTAGYVAALPIIGRAMTFLVGNVQIALLRGRHHVPPIQGGQIAAIAFFGIILLLGLLRPRFWCIYLCPTGALVSLFSLLRLSDRKVTADCIECGACANACPFDAVRDDFTTRWDLCTFCQVCGGVCPPQAIVFTHRWASSNLRPASPDTATSDRPVSRRGFLTATVLGGAATAGLRFGSVPYLTRCRSVIRPPGAVPEEEFLDLCVRCGACLRVCPDSVLQPATVARQGVRGMWTPHAVYSWAGCETECNFCGNACPTGAIRALPIEEKRCAAMGVAVVRRDLCLPHSGVESCTICHDECKSAGYGAISFVRVHAETREGEDGETVLEGGYLAPEVDPVKCVGCGRCENRCYLAYADRLGRAAIHVQPQPVARRQGGAVVLEGGEMRLAPPHSYKAEMERRLAEQKSRKRTIDVEW